MPDHAANQTDLLMQAELVSSVQMYTAVSIMMEDET
jgi:hypothetical protein